jgi:hypothetical protein
MQSIHGHPLAGMARCTPHEGLNNGMKPNRLPRQNLWLRTQHTTGTGRTVRTKFVATPTSKRDCHEALRRVYIATNGSPSTHSRAPKLPACKGNWV